MPVQEFSTYSIAPARGAFAITPNDSTLISPSPRAFYVGGAGNVAVVTNDPVQGTSTATFTGMVAGLIYPIQAIKILATGTTATGLVGLQ